MSYPLVLRPEAEQDLAEGREWYEQRLKGLGVEFLDVVDVALDTIRENPALHPAEYKGVRKAALN